MSETFFVKHQKKDKYTILDKTCILDTRLSWKAKGIHTYLMSLPDDWRIYILEIATHSCDGKSSLYAGISELINLGYIIKLQQRNDNGRFGSTRYYVFENPDDAARFDFTVVEEDSSDNLSSPLSTFPDAEKPYTEKPVPENRTLLNTNKLNTEFTNTELTNYEQPEVSESVFENYIKDLFSGDYPFDKNFENDVRKRLESSQIDESNLEAYLKYVFERTKAANPSKSFEGFYRKLALSNSVSRYFNLSLQNQESVQKKQTTPVIRYVTCTICNTKFDELEYYCPTCGITLNAIRGKDKIEYAVQKKLFEMTPDERQKYEQAYSQWDVQTKAKTKRPFVLDNEKLQFWKDYGILPSETEEK